MDEGGSEPVMEVLDGEECYRLLATQQIGRLGVNAERYPLIYPVNYGLDQLTRSGWSVLVRGLAEEVTSDHRAELVERTVAAGVTPWAPGEHGHWLRLIPHDITGRRIVPGRLPPHFEAAGYL